MADFRSKSNIDALLELFTDIGEAERSAKGLKQADDIVKKQINEGLRKSASTLADDAGVLVGEVIEKSPNFTMRGGDLIPAENIKPVSTAPKAGSLQKAANLMPDNVRDITKDVIVHGSDDAAKVGSKGASMLSKGAGALGRLLGAAGIAWDLYSNTANEKEGLQAIMEDPTKSPEEREQARQQFEAQIKEQNKEPEIDAEPLSDKELEKKGAEVVADQTKQEEKAKEESTKNKVEQEKEAFNTALKVMDSEDKKRLQDAIDERDSKQMWALIIKALGQIAGATVQADVGAANTPVNIDVAPMLAMAENKLKDVQLLQQQEMDDPASKRSAAMRQQLTKLLGQSVPEGLSATQLSKMFPSMMSMKQSQMKADQYQSSADKNRLLREAKFENQQSEEDQKRLERYQKKAESSDQFKKAQTMITNTNNVRNLLIEARDKGGQALAMLGPRIAKGIAGETGVLTEQDVTRYVKDPKVAAGILDSWTKASAGELTQRSFENLSRLVDIMEADAKKQISEVYRKNAVQLSNITGEDVDSVNQKLDPYYRKTQNEAEAITVRRKSDGMTKKLSKDAAQKYINNPNFEVVK